MTLELDQHEADDRGLIVLTLSGELDLTTAPELAERLERPTEDNGSRLVLDLRRVAFIDSAALHVLFRAARGLGKERFGLVVEPDSAISRTLEIVRIAEVATLGESVDDVSFALAPS